jgi:hypothetical protein
MQMAIVKEIYMNFAERQMLDLLPKGRYPISLQGVS